MKDFSVEQLQSILEKTGHFIYDYNIAEGEVRAFGAVEAVTGLSIQEFEQSNIHSWTERIHPEDRAIAHDAQLKFLLDGGPYNGFYRIQKKDGSYVKISDKGYAYEKEEVTGTPKRMTGVITVYNPEQSPS